MHTGYIQSIRKVYMEEDKGETWDSAEHRYFPRADHSGYLTRAKAK